MFLNISSILSEHKTTNVIITRCVILYRNFCSAQD